MRALFFMIGHNRLLLRLDAAPRIAQRVQTSTTAHGLAFPRAGRAEL